MYIFFTVHSGFVFSSAISDFLTFPLLVSSLYFTPATELNESEVQACPLPHICTCIFLPYHQLTSAFLNQPGSKGVPFAQKESPLHKQPRWKTNTIAEYYHCSVNSYWYSTLEQNKRTGLNPPLLRLTDIARIMDPIQVSKGERNFDCCKCFQSHHQY